MKNNPTYGWWFKYLSIENYIIVKSYLLLCPNHFGVQQQNLKLQPVSLEPIKERVKQLLPCNQAALIFVTCLLILEHFNGGESPHSPAFELNPLPICAWCVDFRTFV